MSRVLTFSSATTEAKPLLGKHVGDFAFARDEGVWARPLDMGRREVGLSISGCFAVVSGGGQGTAKVENSENMTSRAAGLGLMPEEG